MVVYWLAVCAPHDNAGLHTDLLVSLTPALAGPNIVEHYFQNLVRKG